ncbi:unnamed protein product [Boreogadus saida]
MTTESKTSTTANEWRVTIKNTVVMSKRKQEGCRDIRQCFASSQKRSKWSDLEVGKEVLRLLVVLGLHDDVRQLVDDDVEGPLGGQRLAEINL